VGYYSICPTEIRRDGLTRRWHGGVTTVPGFMLARLALDARVHGHGLGTQILLDALETICDASALAGGRVVVVDPASDHAASFYGRYGFETVNGSTRMFLLVDDARAALGLGGA
jgi:predicted N-acetyltransferase YhbS